MPYALIMPCKNSHVCKPNSLFSPSINIQVAGNETFFLQETLVEEEKQSAAEE